MELCNKIELDMANLHCNICLNIYEDPYLLPCKAKCIACLKCISKLFKTTPKLYNPASEIQVLGKCVCNSESIIIDRSVPAEGVNRLVKNLISRCPFNKNGCKFFIARDMNEDILKMHHEICG